MSAIGPQQTSLVAPHMSAFGGKADILFQMEWPALHHLHRIAEQILGDITIECRRANVLVPHQLLNCAHPDAFRI